MFDEINVCRETTECKSQNALYGSIRVWCKMSFRNNSEEGRNKFGKKVVINNK